MRKPDLRELVLSAVGEEVLLQPPGLNGEEPGDGVRGYQDVLTAHTESAHVTAFKGTGSQKAYRQDSFPKLRQ
jgi:hypothetical protein